MAYFPAEMMEDTNEEFFILTRKDLRGKLEGKVFSFFLPSWNHVQSLHNPRKVSKKRAVVSIPTKEIDMSEHHRDFFWAALKKAKRQRSKAVIALKNFLVETRVVEFACASPKLELFRVRRYPMKSVFINSPSPLIIDNHDQGYPLWELNQISMHKWCHMIPICLLW